jgi:hypothetical protein
MGSAPPVVWGNKARRGEGHDVNMKRARALGAAGQTSPLHTMEREGRGAKREPAKQGLGATESHLQHAARACLGGDIRYKTKTGKEGTGTGRTRLYLQMDE